MLRDPVPTQIAPRVQGVPESDPDGFIPEELLLTGITVIVPIWRGQSPPAPIGKPPHFDTLLVEMKRDDVVVFSTSTAHEVPIADLEFHIDIGPEHLTTDGVVEVMYTVINFVENESYSFPRRLTIDHIGIPRDLKLVSFPAGGDRVSLNCDSQPPIWEGVEVAVPALPDFVQVGDRCEVHWAGYLTPNGHGAPIDTTLLTIDRPLLNAEDISNGFSVTVEPYRPYIEPMVNAASATALYKIYRGTRLIGLSPRRMVKIDRTVPGQPPCGPAVNSELQYYQCAP